ncbi:MAG TPA: alpha/beta hydrolase [Pyrinomonadaceae bacterium]
MSTRVRVGDHQLECKWIGLGPDEAPTIVFLHEGLGCVEMWRDFPEQVVEATGCGALVYSRAGYGKSDGIVLPRRVEFMHDEALSVLPQILKEFRIDKGILFGHSDGGSISLILAGSGIANNILGLVLEAPHVFVEPIGIESIMKAKQNYEHGSLRASLQKYHGDNVESAFRGWNDVWLNPQFRSWNIESYLPGIRVPALVIQGEQDQYGTLRQVRTIQDASGGPVETLVLSDCGHSPHRDQPKTVLENVPRFIKQYIDRS